MSLVNDVLRPTLALILATTVANCNEGCGPYMSPAAAYAQEAGYCNTKADEGERFCLGVPLEQIRSCREGVDDRWRGCMNMVNNKYGRYTSEGGYPDPNASRFVPPQQR